MNKKIKEAMRQAEKMDAIREEQNRRYQNMQEFRALQDWETENQRAKNMESKAQSGMRYASMKDRILKQNQDFYSEIRTQR